MSGGHLSETAGWKSERSSLRAGHRRPRPVCPVCPVCRQAGECPIMNIQMRYLDIDTALNQRTSFWGNDRREQPKNLPNKTVSKTEDSSPSLLTQRRFRMTVGSRQRSISCLPCLPTGRRQAGDRQAIRLASAASLRDGMMNVQWSGVKYEFWLEYLYSLNLFIYTDGVWISPCIPNRQNVQGFVIYLVEDKVIP